MIFGEIVEPPTRALIDDELEDYPEYVEPIFEWNGDFKLPKSVNKLVFIETIKMKTLATNLVLDKSEFVCKLSDGCIEIRRLDQDYVVLYKENSLTTGQLVEILSEWIKISHSIHCITSQPIVTYQNLNQSNLNEGSLMRILTTTVDYNCEKLEIPNLISGLGAQVLSYCIHEGINCSLYILYMDASPIDSINAKPFIELVKSLKLPLKETFKQADFSSNLYW